MTSAESTRKGDVLLLGGGRFGLLAAKRLGPRVSLIAEPRPGEELLRLGLPVAQKDGVSLAADMLAGPEPPQWVVPTLPRHFLVEWLKLELGDQNPRTVTPPEQCQPEVVSRQEGGEGQVYLSLADFLCPDDCPEPAEFCTVTGKKRGVPLFKRLGAISCPGWRCAVLRSRQLAPGVGGLKLDELVALKENVAAAGGKWLLGTACKCHGVWQGLILDHGKGTGSV